MPVKVDDPTDIQSAYDDSFGDLSGREQSYNSDGSHDSIAGYDRGGDGLDALEDQFKDPSSAVRDKESSGSGGWANNVKSKATDAAAEKATQAALASTGVGAAAAPFASKLISLIPPSLRKKAAAPILVFGLIAAGGAGLATITGPAMLLQQIMETVGAKFDTQRVGVKKTNRLLVKKATSKATGTGRCDIKICTKFNSLSNRQVRLYSQNGLEVTSSTKLLGRTKPTQMSFRGGEPFSASELADRMGNDPKLLDAVNKSNSWRYAFGDRMFRANAKLRSWTKRAPFTKTDDDKDPKKDAEKKRQRLKENAEKGTSGSSSARPTEVDCSGKTGGAKSQCEADNEKARKAQGVDEEVEKAKKLGEKATPSSIKKITGALTISGAVDQMCAVRQMGRAVSTGVKLLRYAVLARYALDFLKVASQIRAGDARPQDVTALGDVLTKTVIQKDENTGEDVRTKAATDGIFYQNAAFGDSGITESSNEFSLGWIAGVAILKAIDQFTPPGTVCSVLGNPITQVSEITVMAVAAFFTGGGAAAAEIAATQGLKALATVALKKALLEAVKFVAKAMTYEMLIEFITKSLIDLIAGKVIDETTFGEKAGDALVSGASALMSRTGNSTGGAPLTAAQAKKFNSKSMKATKVAAAEMDRATLSPFDTSSPYTVLGSIANKFIPYMYSTSSPTNAVAAISSISLSTFANIFSPVTSAATEDAETYDCQDPDLNDMGVGCYQTLATSTGLPVDIMKDFENEVPGATLEDIAMRLRGHTVSFETPASNASVACHRDNGIIWQPGDDEPPVEVDCPDPLITEDGQLESPLSLMYESFVARCILRTGPIGVESEGEEGNGEDCMVNDTATWQNDYSQDKDLESELSWDSGPNDKKILTNQMKVDMYLWWQAMRSHCVNTYGYDNKEGDDPEDKPCQEEFYDSKYIAQRNNERLMGEPATGETGPTASSRSGSSSSSSTGSVSGNLPSGSAQDLAKKLIASGKVTCSNSGPVCDDLKNTADGKDLRQTSGGSCAVPALDPTLLGVLVNLVDAGHSLKYYSMCTGRGSGDHGNGKAIDITTVDGVNIPGGTSGMWSSEINNAFKAFVRDFTSIIPPNRLWVGQRQCHTEWDFMASVSDGYAHYGNDACHHQHIAVGR